MNKKNVGILAGLLMTITCAFGIVCMAGEAYVWTLAVVVVWIIGLLLVIGNMPTKEMVPDRGE